MEVNDVPRLAVLTRSKKHSKTIFNDSSGKVRIRGFFDCRISLSFVIEKSCMYDSFLVKTQLGFRKCFIVALFFFGTNLETVFLKEISSQCRMKYSLSS